MGLDGNKTKLKDADINKVDFVPAGAQQHSRIALFKSEQGIISKITDAITKAMSGFKVVPMDDTEVPEEPETFADELSELKQRRAKDAIMCEVWDYTHAFHETVESIICSEANDKSDLIQGAIDQFGAAVLSALPNWVQGNTVMKIGKKISTQRMEALKACMVQLASLIADAEAEPSVQHEVGDGTIAQPADKTAAPAQSGGQIDNPAGKDTSTTKPKPEQGKPKEGSGGKMAEINKSALPQDVQDYITELEGKVVKAAPEVPAVEDIYKGLPEAVVKMLKDSAEQNKQMASQIAKMRDEQDSKEFIAKAATLCSNLGVSAEEFGPVLKSINAANPELAVKVEAVLKAANEAVAKGDLFTEAGAESTGAPTGVAKSDAWSQIEALASQMVTKGETKTQAEAIDAVCKTAEGRKLYAIYTGKIKG